MHGTARENSSDHSTLLLTRRRPPPGVRAGGNPVAELVAFDHMRKGSMTRMGFAGSFVSTTSRVGRSPGNMA